MEGLINPEGRFVRFRVLSGLPTSACPQKLPCIKVSTRLPIFATPRNRPKILAPLDQQSPEYVSATTAASLPPLECIPSILASLTTPAAARPPLWLLITATPRRTPQHLGTIDQPSFCKHKKPAQRSFLQYICQTPGDHDQQRLYHER